MSRVGVVLLNLGGPERIQDVGPFLYNLFADPEIIRLPSPALQKPLAWLISTLRSGKSQEAYRSIGGGSPLRRITEQQARELQSLLRQRGIDATSYVAMRYWHPFTESAVADIKADGMDEVVVLLLFFDVLFPSPLSLCFLVITLHLESMILLFRVLFLDSFLLEN